MKKFNLNEIEYMNINKDLNYKDIFKNNISKMHLEVFSPKEKIVIFDSKIDTFHFILSGKAKIYMLHEDGNHSLIQFLKEGDFIGELTLLGVEIQTKDVIAINECTCLSIPLDDAKDILLKDNNFLIHISKYLASKLLTRTHFLTKNKNYELKNSLAAYILLSENNGIYSEKHIETADFLGVSYRHLLHTLKLFQEEGLLTKQGKNYLINYDELKVLSKDIF